MRKELKVAIGQNSSAGVKSVNQDSHGAYLAREPQLSSKGIAIAIADGISSSDVSQIASQTAVSGFIGDYYCTSEAWSAKTSGQRVLSAINSWLHAQSQAGPARFNKDKGYVCTFSAVVFKSHSAHIFHVGDSRIYRVSGEGLEQLTQDHRQVLSGGVSYLARALGINHSLDMDYNSFVVEEGDVYILTTDGIHDWLDQKTIARVAVNTECPDAACEELVNRALQRGSDDNLSVVVARVQQLPDFQLDEVHQQAQSLALPPELRPRAKIDGYEIIRDLYISSRSHVFVARDLDTSEHVVLKTPSREQRDNPDYMESFLVEEWIARRLNNAHVLKAPKLERPRNYLYLLTEYIEGQTLEQWMLDHPRPRLERVRDIIEQAAMGLLAFHRQEMLHQDVRPKNIMIDHAGTVKIIDFGATRVGGLSDLKNRSDTQAIVGTVQFTAPEYFIGEYATVRADQFSLGVIAYQMLCGKLPYGGRIGRVTGRRDLNKISYQSLLLERPDLPVWVDESIKKAVHLDPQKRYDEISEFAYDLRRPNRAYLNKTRPPLLERDPARFWQVVSLLLACTCLYLLARPL